MAISSRHVATRCDRGLPATTIARARSEDAAAESGELLEVTSAEAYQLVGSGAGDGEANHPMVVGIRVRRR